MIFCLWGGIGCLERCRCRRSACFGGGRVLVVSTWGFSGLVHPVAAEHLSNALKRVSSDGGNVEETLGRDNAQQYQTIRS